MHRQGLQVLCENVHIGAVQENVDTVGIYEGKILFVRLEKYLISNHYFVIPYQLIYFVLYQQRPPLTLRTWHTLASSSIADISGNLQTTAP